MSYVIVLDSSDEEVIIKEPSMKNKVAKEIHDNNTSMESLNNFDIHDSNDKSPEFAKCSSPEIINNVKKNNKDKRIAINDTLKKDVKRIKPTLVTDVVDKTWYEAESPRLSQEFNEKEHLSSKENSLEDKNEKTRNDINPEFEEFLKVCEKVDDSPEMSIIIEKKLLKYYHAANPDFVNSKGFCKAVKSTASEIENCPTSVFFKIATVVKELKNRRFIRKEKTNNDHYDEKLNLQIKSLNKTLIKITKTITKLEQIEVNWNDESNSTYIQTEKLKARACEIFKKLCSLTGERSHAQRTAKKSIVFNGTDYPEFNKVLQDFINKAKKFPDYADIFCCVRYCNENYSFGLSEEKLTQVSQDAFTKMGEILKRRRQTELYETVDYYIGQNADPATSDAALHAKLSENKKFHSKISTIIDQFAAKQDGLHTEPLLNNKNSSSGTSNKHKIHRENKNQIKDIQGDILTSQNAIERSKSKSPLNNQTNSVDEIIISDEDS